MTTRRTSALLLPAFSGQFRVRLCGSCTEIGASVQTSRLSMEEPLSNSSYSGQLVLLQFWTTWCPYCHRDQPALDNVQAAYASKGLAVLAIDVGEDEATVQRYLQANPRSCQIALDKNHSARLKFRRKRFSALRSDRPAGQHRRNDQWRRRRSIVAALGESRRSYIEAGHGANGCSRNVDWRRRGYSAMD